MSECRRIIPRGDDGVSVKTRSGEDEGRRRYNNIVVILLLLLLLCSIVYRRVCDGDGDDDKI